MGEFYLKNEIEAHFSVPQTKFCFGLSGQEISPKYLQMLYVETKQENAIFHIW